VRGAVSEQPLFSISKKLHYSLKAAIKYTDFYSSNNDLMHFEGDHKQVNIQSVDIRFPVCANNTIGF
jgi:hypothetical protein